MSNNHFQANLNVAQSLASFTIGNNQFQRTSHVIKSPSSLGEFLTSYGINSPNISAVRKPAFQDNSISPKPTVRTKTSGAISPSRWSPSILTILSLTDLNFSVPNQPWWPEGLVSSASSSACSIVLTPAQRCVYRHKNLALLNTTDVILVNGHTAEPDPLPYRRSPNTNPNQRWIYYMMESPSMRYSPSLEILNDVFNATAAYTRDADISIPYGPRCRKGSRTEKGRYDKLRAELTAKVARKTGLVAWFSSNCINVRSMRGQYVKELQKHVRVDVYGACGNLTCAKINADDCDKMLDAKYKFYLAFENSLCDEYITEKFFRMRNIDVVPIVLGKADYRVVAPLSGTYIDVRDFGSVERLAAYIKYLDSTPEEYFKYLVRKRTMVCEVEVEPVCLICKYLHENSDRKAKRELTRFWDESRRCVHWTAFYKNIAPTLLLNTEPILV